MENTPERRVGMFISSTPDETQMHVQPEDSTPTEITSLPLRMLYAGNLAPHRSEHDPILYRVDKNGFAGFMQELGPRLVVDIPNRMGEGSSTLEVRLRFEQMRDFEPGRIAQQVPALNQLLKVRAAVQAVKERDLDLDGFRERLSALGVDDTWAAQLYEALSKPDPSPPSTSAPSTSSSSSSASPSGDDGSIDRLLGMVDTGGGDAASDEEDEGSADGPSGLVDTLMGAVAGESEPGPKVEKSAPDRLIADLDEVLSRQVRAILHAPEVRRLEAAWRGLKFLVDRIRFRENIELDVLPVERDRLSEALYHQVLLPEHDDEIERVPLTTMVLDFDFGNGHLDLELLDDLADTGASLQAPIIAAVKPSFFGVEKATGLDKLPLIWQHLEGPEYIEWNKLRDRKEASFLALAMPAFVLRYPYGEQHPAESFAFTEEEPLWGAASVAVGALIADSFVRTGWPTHLTGGGDRVLEDLPVWASKQGHIPLAAMVPGDKLSELSKAGFVVLGCEKNKDTLHLARAQTVSRPEAHEDHLAAMEAKVHVALASQLFVARAAHFLYLLQQGMEPMDDMEQVKADVEEQLEAFMSVPKRRVPADAISLQAVETPLPTQQLFAVRLRPPRYILDREISLVMGLQVPTTMSMDVEEEGDGEPEE